MTDRIFTPAHAPWSEERTAVIMANLARAKREDQAAHDRTLAKAIALALVTGIFVGGLFVLVFLT